MAYFHERNGIEFFDMRKFPTTTSYVQSSRPPASGVRGAVDSLIQGSLVELFAAYSVAVAPLPRQTRQTTPTLPDISASVGFTRDGVQGRLTLSLPARVLDLMPPSAGGTLKSDWARELANQLIGRIKNRLLQFNVRLQVGVSSILETNKLAHQLESTLDLRIYTGRTLRGEVLVTVDGMPDESKLSYVGTASMRAEGEAILF
jgi:hypothetical protein